MKNLSQTDLAEAVHVTFQQIQKYEKGSNRVSATRLLDIAKVLRVDIKHLLGEKDDHATEDPPLLKFLASKQGSALARSAMTLAPRDLRTLLDLARSLEG